jgi:hypothetical protein
VRPEAGQSEINIVETGWQSCHNLSWNESAIQLNQEQYGKLCAYATARKRSSRPFRPKSKRRHKRKNWTERQNAPFFRLEIRRAIGATKMTNRASQLISSGEVATIAKVGAVLTPSVRLA